MGITKVKGPLPVNLGWRGEGGLKLGFKPIKSNETVSTLTLFSTIYNEKASLRKRGKNTIHLLQYSFVKLTNYSLKKKNIFLIFFF